MEMGDHGESKILPYESSSRGNVSSQKCLLALVVLSVIVSTVALAVAVISITQKSNTTSITVGEQGSKSTGDRIWNIAVGHWANNDIYIDEASGQLKGFYVDMINAVCRLANKDCRIIYDSWRRCWETKEDTPRGGEGLLAGWYDACAGFIETYPRLRTFQFTDKWQNSPELHFLVQDGNDFNSRDITGKIFGFVDGYYNDEYCLARQQGITGSTLSSSQIRIYPKLDDVVNALVAGEIDATIVQEAHWLEVPTSLKYVKDVAIVCTANQGGAGLMLRKDNPLVNWWNPAQRRLMQTSEYKKICQDIKDEHGHMPGRDPEIVCVGFNA